MISAKKGRKPKKALPFCINIFTLNTSRWHSKSSENEDLNTILSDGNDVEGCDDVMQDDFGTSLYRDTFRSDIPRLRSVPIDLQDQLLLDLPLELSSLPKKRGRPRNILGCTIEQQREEKRILARNEFETILEHAQEYIEWERADFSRKDQFDILINTLVSLLCGGGCLSKKAYKIAAREAGVSQRTAQRWWHDFKENGYRFPEDLRGKHGGNDILFTEVFKAIATTYLRKSTG